MSDYPNMSYCMCNNTLLALRQVVTAMVEQGPDFLREMSVEEQRAYRALFNMCEEFLISSEDIDQELSREECDGQPTEQQEWADYDPDC